MTLAEWMKASDVSDEALAEKLGWDRSTISRVRRGKLIPSHGLIAAVVKASNGEVDPATFFRPPYVDAA